MVTNLVTKNEHWEASIVENNSQQDYYSALPGIPVEEMV